MVKKSVLFVVDERMMGGVSILLKEMLYMMDRNDLDIDVLVLHNRGDMLDDLPSDVNVIYGTKYFSAIDLPLKEIIKSKKIGSFFRKIQTIIDLKTGHVKKRIIKERKKMGLKHYDYEIAFKDGYTAVFSAFSDSNVKYHWIQFDYSLGNPNANYPRIMEEVISKFDKIISVSKGTSDGFNSIYHIEDKTIIIDNVVNIDVIKEKSKEESDVILEQEKFNIICVGRLANYCKGYDRLVEIVRKLKNDGLFDDCILRIYGDGPDKSELQKMIDESSLNDCFKLMGRVNNPYKYYKGNDLFILSSRYEAFGLVLVEAMTLGVPVLAVKNNATDKLIKNGVYGDIVENTDEALYEGLKKLIVDRKIVAKYKKNLNNYKYKNDEIIKKINRLFK